jgi:triacylglycerol esterase/lipase EstA (alpha/beta hydrolase family)
MRVRRLVASAIALVLLALVAPLSGSAGAATRDPVIIVAGTSANQPLASIYYAPLAARLRADGYNAFIFGLPGGGLGDIAATSAALNNYADSVRAQTGATKIDLVGHSQGGLVGRYYIKNVGGANEVDSMISLGAPHYGTAVANIAAFLGLGNCLGIVACNQMAVGSTFLNNLNAGDDTIGTVHYTNIASIFDEVVVPYKTAFLNNDGNNTNVRLQSPCWARVVDHIGLPLDGTVYSGIADALAHAPITLNCFAL